MEKYVFGVDVGGTAIKLGLFTPTGTLLEKWQIDTHVRENEHGILEDIAAAIREKLKEKQIPQSDVLGIGMGVPGAVLPDGTVNKCVNLGWGVIKAGEILQQLLGVPVKIGNDANVAALGEQFKGSAEGLDNCVMVTLGTGVGAGIILNGQIVPGSFGAAGEIGHFVMKDGEPDVCGCGKRGCLEQYTSANGVVRLGKRHAQGQPSILGKTAPIDSIQVFSAAKQGDTAAQAALQEMFDLLGRALAYTAAVIDPQAFVIGGGVSNAGTVLTEGIGAAYRKYCFHASAHTKILLASLGNDAGIYGACKLALDAGKGL